MIPVSSILSYKTRRDKAYLRSKVEAQVTTAETILDEEWNLLGEVQHHRGGQVGGLAEIDEVLEGEGQGDGFGEGDGNVLVGLVDVGVLADSNGTVTDVTLAGELDTLLAGLNHDCEMLASVLLRRQ
jgi:hypothetical protein